MPAIVEVASPIARTVIATRSTSIELKIRSVARIESWVFEVDGRKVRMRARITDQNGEAYCEAEGLFIQMKSEQMNLLMESAAKP